MGTRDHLWNICRVAGGGKRDRTADLLHAMQALSQLSYTPTTERRIIAAGVTLVKPSRTKMGAIQTDVVGDQAASLTSWVQY